VIDYLCRLVSGTATAGDDASRVAWVREDELSGYRVTEGAVAVIEKAFRERGE